MDTKPRTQKLEPSESAALRCRIVDEIVRPDVIDVFRQCPQVQSAVFMVAQFWDDEASDAVHSLLLYSSCIEPDIAAYRRAVSAEDFGENMEYDEYETWRYFVEGDKSTLPREFFQSRDYYLRNWNDNGDDFISSFAAFCEDGCDQEMPAGSAFSPYAIFRRSNDGLEIMLEVVGKMIRPQLDGLPTEWALEEAQRPDVTEPAGPVVEVPPAASKPSLLERIKKLWN